MVYNINKYRNKRREELLNLNKDIIKEIVDISKKYDGIKKVVLFGSRARGDNELKSDIDLGIYCDSDLLLFIEEIENNTHTLLEFDFSDMNNIRDEFFIEQVEKEGILLWLLHFLLVALLKILQLLNKCWIDVKLFISDYKIPIEST